MDPERRQCGGLFVTKRPRVIPSVVATRGPDLSGTLAGAGGIGGLLARSRHATSSPYAVNGSSFYHADGNGNVTYLASASGGADAAYKYDPFGRWLAQTGPYASANVMRFSSKPWVAHNGSNSDGLYYYGYRFYDPLTQRWLNRDPMGERGAEVLLRRKGRLHPKYAELLPDGPNLYGFVHNDPVSLIDADGRAIPVAVAAALVVIAAVEACAWPQYKAAFNRYPDSGDKFKHCWVSCQISKSCGGLLAELAGLAKEIQDRAIEVYCEMFPDSEICQGGHGDFWDSIQDLLANQQCIGWESLVFGAPGGWIGTLCRRSCEACCKEKVGYNTGEP
jgi:RHS repeat-associated protein